MVIDLYWYGDNEEKYMRKFEMRLFEVDSPFGKFQVIISEKISGEWKKYGILEKDVRSDAIYLAHAELGGKGSSVSEKGLKINEIPTDFEASKKMDGGYIKRIIKGNNPMKKLRRNPTKLHSTFKSDTYYTSFNNLPKKAQEILINTPVEVERSRYTMYEPVAFVRNKIEIDGRYFDAEINLDRVDIKDAGYDYDNDKDSYVDDQGRSVDEDEYSEWFAKELWDLAVLDKNVYHYDVYLTETDEPRPERRMGERLRRNPTKLHSTLKSDTYYTNFSNLPKAAQELLENTPAEVENSKYTVYEDMAFIRNRIIVDNKIYDAEISLGSVDIKNSDYEYDSKKDEYIDDEGRVVDKDKYAEWMTEELCAVTDLQHQDVYLTEVDEDVAIKKNPSKSKYEVFSDKGSNDRKKYYGIRKDGKVIEHGFGRKKDAIEHIKKLNKK